MFRAASEDRKLITHRFTFACEFHKSLKIFELAVYLLVEIKSFLKTRALTKDLAGAFLVGIEVWFGDLLLKCIELSPLAVDVKETRTSSLRVLS